MWRGLPASVWNTPEKHILEEFLCVHKLILEFVSTSLSLMVLSSRGATATTLFALLVPGYAAKLIIRSTLILIAEGLHRIIYALECFFSLRSVVLIWMQFQRALLVTFLEFSLICLLWHTKHFIIASISQYFTGNFGLFGSVRFRGGFFLLLPFWRQWFFRLAGSLRWWRRAPANYIESLKPNLGFLRFMQLYAFDKKPFGLVELSYVY